MVDVTMKDLGGAMAGSVIASAILDTLVRKGVILTADARATVRQARDAIGHPPVGELDLQAAEILDWMLKHRFPADSGNE